MYESLVTPLNVLLFVLIVFLFLSKKSFYTPPSGPIQGVTPPAPTQTNVSSFTGTTSARLGTPITDKAVIIPTAAPGAPPPPQGVASTTVPPTAPYLSEPACDVAWDNKPVAKGGACCSFRTKNQCGWDADSNSQMTCQDVSTNKVRSFVCLPKDNKPSTNQVVIALKLDPGMKPPSTSTPPVKK
jgi:hypothetical protein